MARWLPAGIALLGCSLTFPAIGQDAIPPGTTYYVSASGNDANDGRSPAAPWQTLAKVNGATFRAGDKILFKGGDTFVGQLLLVGPNAGVPQKLFPARDTPITIGAYGGTCAVLANETAGCPILSTSGVTTDGIVINNLSDIIVRDWIVVASDPRGRKTGVYLRNNDPTGAVYERVTVTNVSITGFQFGILAQGTVARAGWRDFVISKNKIFGTLGTEDNGIQIQGPRPGKPGVMTNFNCTIEGNLVDGIPGRANSPGGTSGNGILIKETDGCLDQFNVVRNGGRNTNTCGGPVGNWAYDATNIRIRFNETSGMGPSNWTAGCDWGGFHLDGYVSNSVIEYSYAHDNWGAGFALWVTDSNGWHHNVIRYNVSENNGTSARAEFFGGILITNNNQSLVGTYIYNNTIYSNSTAYGTTLLAVQGNLAGDCIIANNLLLKASPNPFFVNTGIASNANCKIVGNDYFSPSPSNFRLKWNGSIYSSLPAFRAGTGQESIREKPAGFSTDPLIPTAAAEFCPRFSNPIEACPAGFTLKSASPLVGAGVDLRKLYGIDAGTRDFYGHQIPHDVGSGVNIGAYGAR